MGETVDANCTEGSTTVTHLRHPGAVMLVAALLLSLVLGTSAVAVRVAEAQPDPRFFAETGFRIGNDRFWDFIQHRGGVRTFGYPASREFLFQGFQVQFFQRGVMQPWPDGSVKTLNLLDDGLLP